jgi:hypothetical protein
MAGPVRNPTYKKIAYCAPEHPKPPAHSLGGIYSPTPPRSARYFAHLTRPHDDQVTDQASLSSSRLPIASNAAATVSIFVG